MSFGYTAGKRLLTQHQGRTLSKSWEQNVLLCAVHIPERSDTLCFYGEMESMSKERRGRNFHDGNQGSFAEEGIFSYKLFMMREFYASVLDSPSFCGILAGEVH